MAFGHSSGGQNVAATFARVRFGDKRGVVDDDNDVDCVNGVSRLQKLLLTTRAEKKSLKIT